jgi:hypothetical protein
VPDTGASGGNVDIVRAVGFGTLVGNSSTVRVGDFSSFKGDAGGFAFAFAFDFRFGGFFTESASDATIRGPWTSNVSPPLGARSLSGAICSGPPP